MPKYAGSILYEFRLELPRPEWSNYNTTQRRSDYDIATLKDMTAMINFCMRRKGLTRRLPWRSYERWEQTTFPEWFRMGIIWMHPEIKAVIRDAHKYNLLKGGYHVKRPILELAQNLEERLNNVKIDKSITKGQAHMAM